MQKGAGIKVNISDGACGITIVRFSGLCINICYGGNKLLRKPIKKIAFPKRLFLHQIIFLSLTIQTKNLVKIYGSRTVVNNVSFNVKQGEIVGLLGPNGAGKTTSFYQVVGLIKPDEGEVFLNDLNITRLPMYKRAQMGIGYLPQEASVFRKLSVEDNISAVLEMTKLKKSEQKEKLESLLDEFRLQRVRKNNGDTLSGGERRRDRKSTRLNSSHLSVSRMPSSA